MNYFSDPSLISSLPVKRAAYSDRTAWMMAELSRLIYEKLPLEISTLALFENVKKALENDDEKTVIDILNGRLESENEIPSLLESALETGGFELLEPFVKGSTEAMLVRMKPNGDFEGMLVVVFRGTEKKLADIKTDLTSNLIDVDGGGRGHKGFIDAFNLVHEQIASALEGYKGHPVYFCGHSLGGALALVATRLIGNDSVGATYTFGGPRVGTTKFFQSIKTPVYRVVNAADGVPRIPFGAGFVIFLWLIRFIPYIGAKLSEFLRENLSGYTHYGNLVYLPALKQSGEYKEAEVIKSPNYFFVIWNAGLRLLATKGKAGADDHMMTEYCQKLQAYAKRRQTNI
ncbi:MAG: DUF2974 domain-containing protein [Neptuniibacter sp.]